MPINPTNSTVVKGLRFVPLDAGLETTNEYKIRTKIKNLKTSLETELIVQHTLFFFKDWLVLFNF